MARQDASPEVSSGMGSRALLGDCVSQIASDRLKAASPSRSAGPIPLSSSCSRCRSSRAPMAGAGDTRRDTIPSHARPMERITRRMTQPGSSIRGTSRQVNLRGAGWVWLRRTSRAARAKRSSRFSHSSHCASVMFARRAARSFCHARPASGLLNAGVTALNRGPETEPVRSLSEPPIMRPPADVRRGRRLPCGRSRPSARQARPARNRAA